MSGGSMNYIYSRLLVDATFSKHTPERKAFAKHLKLISKALHDIECVDSGDDERGIENAAIRACLHPGAVLESTIETAHQALKELRHELEMTCSGNPNYRGK